MSNNLIIINAHIVTPQGRTARKGEAMNELLTIPLRNGKSNRRLY